MPSRLPPSQRSAAFGLHRLPAAVKQAFTGAGRVANATPVRTSIPNRVAPPSAGGGGDTDHPGTGSNSVQIGPGADAQSAADGGVAIGNNATVTGNQGVVIGPASTAGQGTTSVGSTNTDGGAFNTLIGHSVSSASGADSGVGIGDDPTINGDYGVAVGRQARAGLDSVCIGRGDANGTRRVAIGRRGINSKDDTSCIAGDEMWVKSSSTTGSQTWLVLYDSAGSPWLIGVDTSGNVVAAGAATP